MVSISACHQAVRRRPGFNSQSGSFPRSLTFAFFLPQKVVVVVGSKGRGTRSCDEAVGHVVTVFLVPRLQIGYEIIAYDYTGYSHPICCYYKGRHVSIRWSWTRLRVTKRTRSSFATSPKCSSHTTRPDCVFFTQCKEVLEILLASSAL